MIRPGLQGILEALISSIDKDIHYFFRATGLGRESFVIVGDEQELQVWDLEDVGRIPGIAGLCIHLERGGKIETIQVGLGEHAARVAAIEDLLGEPVKLTASTDSAFHPVTPGSWGQTPLFKVSVGMANIYGLWPGLMGALCSHLSIVKRGAELPGVDTFDVPEVLLR